MANRLTVHVNRQPCYDIYLDSDFSALSREAEKLDLQNRKVCIVTDSHVAPLYLDEVRSIFSQICRKAETFVFSAGEEQKNLDTVQAVYEKLIRSQFDRKDYLVALGGGVVGDLCGYAAATYLRGVGFIQIPTTLLSQVDSSIGGKTGVDFSAYKNMVGAFHMPSLVYINTATILTLTDEQYASGMGEVIKHGLIQDQDYYRWISDNRNAIWNRDLDVCEEMVLRSDAIKRYVVEQDPREQGVRALLNFGHTLGHAIEKLSNFHLLHGHCVGLGCLAAVCMSANRGWISTVDLVSLRELMQAFHMPVTVSDMPMNEIIAATRLDKKMDSGSIRFILLKAIGDACVDGNVSDQEMEMGLEYILI